jgi:hypothetical protein
MSEIIIMWPATIKKNVECGPRVKKVTHPWSKHQLSKTSTVQKIYYLIINLLIMQNLLANLTKNVNLKVCWRVVVVKAD